MREAEQIDALFTLVFGDGIGLKRAQGQTGWYFVGDGQYGCEFGFQTFMCGRARCQGFKRRMGIEIKNAVAETPNIKSFVILFFNNSTELVDRSNPLDDKYFFGFSCNVDPTRRQFCPIGVKTVTYTATDSKGNIGTCSICLNDLVKSAAIVP